MGIAPGTKFGPYEVIDLLGAGGMGEVYRAHDPRMRREVALKVVRADSITQEALRRFQQEARTSAAINHPNIITVHDVGETDGVPYLVCELLQGETLRERMRRGRIPSDKAIDVTIQIARGLAAAHERGIVHRDLKPENLFLTRDGVVKLMDFGIAKLRPTAADNVAQQTTMAQTEAGLIVGTAAYMSPEQVAGKPVDHRSDLFSLGSVLYEMLSGARPFTGETSADTMAAILRATPTPLVARDATLPAALDRIVAHCLEKDPALRFQSARDVAFSLESLASSAQSSGVTSAAAAAPALSARGASRLGWWMLPAAALLGAAAVYGVQTLRRPPDAPAFTRVIRMATAEIAENTPALSPDGKWMAYIGEVKGRGDVYVRFLNGGEPINLTANFTDVSVSQRNDIGGIDVSPDGSQIAFAAGPRGAIASGQSTYVIPGPLGGSARKLIDHVAGMRWSRDGTKIVYVRPGGSAGDSLVVADANGDHAREILPVSGGLHTHWPAWSADGKYIYFTQSIVTGNAEPSQIFRISEAGGSAECVIPTSRRAVYAYPTADARGLIYSANPTGAELALYWQPFNRPPIRLTTGVGEYAQARVSADGHTMIAVAYDVRWSIEAISVPTAAGDRASPVSFGATGDTDLTVSAAINRLAFVSGRAGGRNIWTSALDGSDAAQVTSGPELDERPAWSPDGSQIAFASGRNGVRGIWTIARDGGIARHVTDAQVLDVLTWSPDGKEIVFAAPDGDVPHLFRVSSAGGTPQRLPTRGPAVAPAWSAKRNLIAYIESRRPSDTSASAAHLAIVTPDGHPIGDFAGLIPTLTNGMVSWSQDGRYLAGYVDPGGTIGALWVVDVDRATSRQMLVLSTDQRFRGVAWLPGNDRLLYGIQTQTSDLVLFDQGR